MGLGGRSADQATIADRLSANYAAIDAYEVIAGLADPDELLDELAAL